jgi:hypothetical protein
MGHLAVGRFLISVSEPGQAAILQHRCITHEVVFVAGSREV